MEMAARFRRWFEYEKDAHAKVLESLQQVSAEKRRQPEFEQAVDLMAHVAAARWLWLYRLGSADAAPAEVFPRRVDLDGLTRMMASMQAAWSSYLEELDDTEVARVFEYTALDGVRFRNSIEDVLTQLYGHSLYHRGQVASRLRSIGATPAATDFLYWTREKV
jgi:uncharacterized damage-inducible protein DinB